MPARRSSRSSSSDFAPPGSRSVPWFRSFWLWLTVAIVLGLILLRTLGRGTVADDRDAVPTLGWERVAVYPHDFTAYTQGLTLHDGKLYESTGRFGESSMREVEVTTGRVLRRRDLDDSIFGEGSCRWENRWLMLTWKNEILFELDDSFATVAEHEWPHQGWGLTHDGRRLIVSDGTERLFFLDPKTFREIGHVDVTMDGRRLDHLNELEFIDGYVWANVWYENDLVKIDPADGRVVARVDLTELRKEVRLADPDAVVNGIAYDAADGTLLVTGKLWPKLFRIRLKD